MGLFRESKRFPQAKNKSGSRLKHYRNITISNFPGKRQEKCFESRNDRFESRSKLSTVENTLVQACSTTVVFGLVVSRSQVTREVGLFRESKRFPQAKNKSASRLRHYRNISISNFPGKRREKCFESRNDRFEIRSKLSTAEKHLDVGMFEHRGFRPNLFTPQVAIIFMRDGRTFLNGERKLVKPCQILKGFNIRSVFMGLCGHFRRNRIPVNMTEKHNLNAGNTDPRRQPVLTPD